MDELGIENAALVVDKDKVNELPVPFLVHTQSDGGKFLNVTDVARFTNPLSGDYTIWNGIVLAAEKPAQWDHAENAEWLKKEKNRQSILWMAAGILFLFVVAALFMSFSWQMAGLLLSSLAGLFIAVLIVQQELGISNTITEQFCSSSGKNTGCEAVIQSKGSGLAGGFNWSDTGVIYFSFLLLLSSGSLYINQSIAIFPVFSFLSAVSLPFTAFSLYYQARVVKKWCRLCLLTVMVLWVQFIFTAFQFAYYGFSSLSLPVILYAGFLFFAVATVWLLLVRPTLKRLKELQEQNFSLLLFKNDPEVFEALSKEQRQVDIKPFDNDWQLGNPASPVQLTVACNPYCGPCAKAHETLHELVEKHNIGLTIRFAIKTENKNDKKLQAAGYILQLIYEKPEAYTRKVLHDWYSILDFEKFSREYSLSQPVGIDKLLEQHEHWTQESKITATPTIFINAYELPKQYRIEDLKVIIRNMEKRAVMKKWLSAENDYILV